MMIGVIDIVGGRRDRQVAALRWREVLVGRCQMQAANTVLLPETMRAAIGAVITERAGKRVRKRVGGVVDDLEFEHRDRHRGIAVIMRDERTESRHPHAARETLVAEDEISHRKAAVEIDLAEMRDANQRLTIGPVAEAVEHLADARRAGGVEVIGSVQHPCVDERAVPLGLDRKMRIAVIALQSRPVADRPVDQPAAAGNGKSTGADAAERKGDVARALAPIGKTRFYRSKVVPHHKQIPRC